MQSEIMIFNILWRKWYMRMKVPRAHKSHNVVLTVGMKQINSNILEYLLYPAPLLEWNFILKEGK